VNRIKIFLTVLVAIIAVCGAKLYFFDHLNGASSTHFVMVQGNVLYCFKGNEVTEVKRAPIFYGYGWIDRNKFFYVYQPQDYAEAIAKVQVVEADSLKEYNIASLGGVGESNFDGNQTNHAIVFNKFDGIYCIHESNQGWVISKLSNDRDVSGIFWVDAKTIGYMHFVDGKPRFGKAVYQP